MDIVSTLTRSRYPSPCATKPGGALGIEQFGNAQDLERTAKFSDVLICGLIFTMPIGPFAMLGAENCYAQIDAKRGVPVNTPFVIAGISLVLGHYLIG